MKTSYCLVAAAGLTAVGFLYVKRPAPVPPEVPSLPVPADQVGPPPPDPWAEPPLAPVVDLPPIPTPSDAPLVIPAGGNLPVPVPASPPPLPTPPGVAGGERPPAPNSPAPLPVPTPDVPPPALPAVPPVEATPAVPELPTPPASKLPEPPAVPVPPITPEAPPIAPVTPTPPTPSIPSAPPAPPVTEPVPTPPTLPELPVAKPTDTTPVKPIDVPRVQPIAPPATTAPVAPPTLPQPVPQPVPTPPKPTAQLPAPTPLPAADTPPVVLAKSGKFAVLKGHKLVEGAVTVAADQVIVRQGSLDRPFPKGEVLFVAETRDDVYRFMLGRVSATDPVARLAVARWCTFSGLREQALAETREVLRLQPENTTAVDMARSLEDSLKLFPADGSSPVVAAKPAEGQPAAEPEVDVTPEGASTFATRAQPVLANQCMECHARPDHPGALKLTRVTGYEAGPHTTKANLRAVASQLKKDDPLRSPLLAKALTTHGTMKEPAFANRQVPAYRALEAWVLQAAGTPVPAMTPPVQPTLPPPAPATSQNAAAVPPVSSPATSPPVLPPVEPAPALPAVPPPAAAAPVPPVLPTPPSIPPAAPLDPPAVPTVPVIPPAEADPKVPTVPAIPVIPPAAAELPKLPGGVQPAGGQFGTSAPPKPPATQPNTKGDEFDPDAFNKPGPTGK